MVDAYARLRAWIRDFGHEKQAAFIADLTSVLDDLAEARKQLAAMTERAENAEREADDLESNLRATSRQLSIRAEAAEKRVAELERECANQVKRTMEIYGALVEASALIVPGRSSSWGKEAIVNNTVKVIRDHREFHFQEKTGRDYIDKMDDRIAELEAENADLRSRLLTAAGDDLCRPIPEPREASE